MNDGPVIFFDGVCNLCNGAVRFVLRHDRRARFRFASLQSPAARRLLAPAGIDPLDLDSMVLLENGHVHVRSAAALRMVRGLGGVWTLATVFLCVPPPVRDAVYRFIARRRYRWFGRRDACLAPTPETRARFLQD